MIFIRDFVEALKLVASCAGGAVEFEPLGCNSWRRSAPDSPAPFVIVTPVRL